MGSQYYHTSKPAFQFSKKTIPTSVKKQKTIIERNHWWKNQRCRNDRLESVHPLLYIFLFCCCLICTETNVLDNLSLFSANSFMYMQSQMESPFMSQRFVKLPGSHVAMVGKIFITARCDEWWHHLDEERKLTVDRLCTPFLLSSVVSDRLGKQRNVSIFFCTINLSLAVQLPMEHY